MDAFYQLIDLTSGNVVGNYDTIDDALAEIRRFADAYDLTKVVDYSLVNVDHHQQRVIAAQDELVKLATAGNRVLTATR